MESSRQQRRFPIIWGATIPILVAAILFLTFTPEKISRESQGVDALPVENVSTGPAKASFSVHYKDVESPYRVMSALVMPGETVEFEATFPEGNASAVFVAGGGRMIEGGSGRWTWRAPQEPGMVPIRIHNLDAGETITIHAFVLVPFDHRSYALNGYKIGKYEEKPLKNNPFYNRPKGFIEVTEDNLDTPVSPHFTLGQFVAKQKSDFPKYLVIREELLLKLEMMLEQLNEAGFDLKTLHVMSGYRTPSYNLSIGNVTAYSQHLYGGAADIFVDRDGDEMMDDLNGDGIITIADAENLAEIAERHWDGTGYRPFVGGIGVYDSTSDHGPFVHVDVRGERARW